MLTYTSGRIGGEPDVGFERMVWIEGAEEVTVKVFVGGWIFIIVVGGTACCKLLTRIKDAKAPHPIHNPAYNDNCVN